jgi:hypothetical protein
MPDNFQPMRVIKECLDPAYVIVLVHGTWSEAATWTKRGSTMINHLVSTLGTDVAIYARDWSGRNSIGQRALGAAALESDLRGLHSRFPTAWLGVVAHSHGGNVAAKAVANTGSASIGLACLSTPFLRASERTAGAWSAKAVVKFLFVFLQLIVMEVTLHLAAYSRWGGRHEEIVLFVGGYLAVMVFKVYRHVSLKAPMAFESAGHRLATAVNYTLRPNARLLIIKMADDEAGIALAAYRFVDWILERYLVLVCQINSSLTSRRKRERWFGYKGIYGPRLKPRLSDVLWGLTLVVLPLAMWLYYGIRDSDHPVGNVVLIYFLAFSTIMSGMFVVLCSIVLVSIAPLGWSNVLGIFDQVISVESSPPGSWNLNLFEPSPSATGLRHSQPCQDSRCLSLLASWIKEQRNYRYV